MTMLVMVALFAILAIFGVPVAIAIGVSTVLALVATSDLTVLTVAQKMVTGIGSFTLLAIPLFMLTGRLMNDGGISERIFNFARVFVGHIRGGLGHVNVVASMIFAGMSGSAVADAGGLGQVEMKVMSDQGYPAEYSAAITAASSAIGPIIPPSIPFVIYATIAEVSPGKLFLAGFFPGILMGLTMMIMIYLLSFKKNFPRDQRASWSEKWRATKAAILPILTPFIILGGIMGGIFTPTEASAVAAVYAFVLGFFVYKTIKLKDLPSIMIDTINTTAVVTFIISTSTSFSWVLIVGGAASKLLEVILMISTNKFVILLLLNVAMLLLGCVMENGSLLILLTPLLLPLAKELNVDLIQFGVIMVLNLMIGVVTPPVGMSLFVVSRLSGVSVEKMARPVLQMVIPLMVVLLLVTYVPEVSMWFPRLFS
jgi:tripartite ATP-independent transporter DctM subunit